MRRINYKSDIPPLLLSLKVDENQITVPDCDFIVRFYIEGYEGRHYDCSHIGGVWSNCEPSEDGTKLVCYINNQRLGIGELCAEFHYISPDRRYSDGSQKSVVIIDSTELGVELVEDNGDAVTEAAIDVALPFIYRTAYEIARDHGYTGTAEDFYSALASVVAIADAENKRVTAEITRNANEQERIENEENRLNAENERVNAEAQRVRNEAIRGDAESDRVEQEEDRKAKFEEITEFIATVRANEGNRESNERERQTNEDTRITEEAKRVEAEKKRAAEFEQQKLDLTGKIDRSGDEMGGNLIFTDNAGVSFRTSDGGAHTMFNDTDDVAKFTDDNGDTFEFKQNETPNKNSSAVVVSANLYNALDMTLDSMGSALDGDAAYRAEAGDKIFNPDTCKIQRYSSTIGGFEDLCDPIEGKLYANKMTGYIYRWDTKAKKMVFVGGVKAYTKEEADSRFAKLDDATQIVKVKELDANNSVTAKSMWIGDEGLLLGGDGNGHLTVEQDEVITDVTLNEKLATKADDVAYGVEWNNGQPTGEMQETTVKDATKNTTVATLFLAQSCNALEQEVEKKADKTELDTKVSKSDITQSTGTSTTAVMSQKAVSDIVDELEREVNAADEEDITVIEENGKQKLKFADRNYEPLNASGKGYKILRKNIIEIEDENSSKVRKNILTKEMINEPNTVYEIRYDFDLNGEEITIPENCVLKFNGGSFKNGILNGNSAYISNKENTLIFKDVKINNCVSDTVSSDWFFTYRNGYQYTSIDKTGYTVNGVQYPLKTTLPLSYNDDTWNLQQLLNIDANTYIIEEGIYMINPDKNDSEGIDDNRYGGLKFKGKSNKKIQIKGVLKAIPSQIGKGSLFRLQECNNVILCGNGTFQGDLGEVLKDGEFGTFGILINSSSYITIRDLTFEYFSIDGVYISWRKYRSDTDHNIQHHHVIDNITCRCNRRTGLVYEIGDYVVIKNSNFISNGTVRGAATYSGINIEPFGDASAPKRYCRNFLIKNNKFITNKGTGLRTERCLDIIIYGNYFYRNSTNIELHRSFYSTEDITDSRNIRYISGKSYVYNNFFDGGSTINANYSNGCVDFYNNFCINQDLILDGQWIYSNFYSNLIINCVRFGSITAIDTNIYSNLVEGISMSSEKYLLGNNSPIFIRLQKSKNVKIYNNNLYYCRGKVIEGAGDKGNTPLPFTEFKNYPYMIDSESISTTQIYNNYIDHRYFGQVLTKANIYGNIAINNSIEENDLYICYSGDTIISNKYKQKGIAAKNARVKVDDECIEFSANLEVSKNTKICNSERTKMFVAITDGTLGDTFPSGYSSGTCQTIPLPLSSPNIVWCNTGICTSETRPNFLNSVGRRLLETDTNLLIEYNGKAWSVISNNYKGSTNQRPLLGNNDLGVEYYDTTIKKKIVWDGTKWVNTDGTNLI